MEEFTKDQMLNLRDECVSLIVKAVEAVKRECRLSDVQGSDVLTPILTKLTCDAIDRALHFTIHLMEDEMEKGIPQ